MLECGLRPGGAIRAYAPEGSRKKDVGLRDAGYGLRVAGCRLRVGEWLNIFDSILSIFNSGIGVESVRQLSPLPGETQYEKT